MGVEDDTSERDSIQIASARWPPWVRILSGGSAVVVTALGLYMAVIREFGLKHAHNPGKGFELTGVPAVIAGVAMSLWGAAMLAYVLFPTARIWRKRSFFNEQERTDD